MKNLTPAELTVILRMRTDITQTRLGQLLGAPPVTISLIESGDRLPSWTLIDAAARLGGLYLAWAKAVCLYRAPNLFDECEESLLEGSQWTTSASPTN